MRRQKLQISLTKILLNFMPSLKELEVNYVSKIIRSFNPRCNTLPFVLYSHWQAVPKIKVQLVKLFNVLYFLSSLVVFLRQVK